MLTFDSVKLRLEREQSLSYMEFNYMILQSYDFYQLFKKNNCVLQIGGSDQWGNIVNGVELIRRMLQKEAYGLTTPLITLASGAKMGKTEKGAIWLNESLFSHMIIGSFGEIQTTEILKILKFFTEIKISKIDELIEKEKNINKLKILLANEATKILHGSAAAKKAEITSIKTFETGGFGSDLPEVKIKENHLKNGIKIIELLYLNNIMSSKSEARRAIKNKAIKINNLTISDENKVIGMTDFDKQKVLKISFGKKKHYLIKII